MMVTVYVNAHEFAKLHSGMSCQGYLHPGNMPNLIAVTVPIEQIGVQVETHSKHGDYVTNVVQVLGD